MYVTGTSRKARVSDDQNITGLLYFSPLVSQSIVIHDNHDLKRARKKYHVI